MAISSITKPIVNSRFGRYVASTAQKVEQSVLNAIPNYEIKNKKYLDNIGKINTKLSPAEQRLIFGATALMFQPFIDMSNKDVDEETRNVSVARTIAKIIAGTSTGYLIRKGCIKGIAKTSKPFENGVKKFNNLFTPSKQLSPEQMEQYRNTMGTIVALVVMMVSNFVIDAPLTKFLTNKFMGVKGGNNEASK